MLATSCALLLVHSTADDGLTVAVPTEATASAPPGDASPTTLRHTRARTASVHCLDSRRRVVVAYECVVWSSAKSIDDDVRFGPPTVRGSFLAAAASSRMGSAVYAFDARHGTARWRRAVPGRVERPVAIASGIVHVASRTGPVETALRALAAHDGSLRWERDLPVDTRIGPLTPDDVVVVGGAGPSGTDRLVAFDARSGRQRWAQDVPAGLTDVAAAHGVVLRADEDGVVTAVDAGSGALRWRREVGRRMGRVHAGLVPIFDSGRLTVLTAGDGAVRWARDLPPEESVAPVPAPIISAGRVFVRRHGVVRAYRSTDGSALPPVESNAESRLLGGSGDGTVYTWAGSRIAAINPPHRRVSWRAFAVVGLDSAAPAAALPTGDLVVRVLPGDLVRLRAPGA